MRWSMGTMVLIVAASASCASGGGSGPQTAPRDREVTVVDIPEHGTMRFEIMRDDEVSTTFLPLEAEAVWRNLLPAYGTLGVDARQLTTFDPATRQIAVSNQRFRRLADRPLSDFLNCGYSLTNPRADQGQVTVSFVSWVEPAEDGSLLHTSVAGTARDRGISAGLTRCSTLGTLEKLIVEQVILRAMPGSG
jgi:hypothetical protein